MYWVAEVGESIAARALMRQIYGPAEAELREIVESVVAEENAEPHLQVEKYLTTAQRMGLQQTVSPPPLSGFSAFPTDANDWLGVFDRRPSYNDLSGTQTQNDKLYTDILSDRPRGLPQTVIEFRHFLDLTSSTVITIISHNDGEVLVVPPEEGLDGHREAGHYGFQLLWDTARVGEIGDNEAGHAREQ